MELVFIFENRVAIVFYSIAGKPQSWPSLTRQPVYEIDYASDRCFSIIAKWIADRGTTHGHPECQRQAAGILPRHIIDVGTNHETAYLYETKGEYAS